MDTRGLGKPDMLGGSEMKRSNCESGCAYKGMIDVVTNLLMKVQHVTVSENSVHNSCVSLTLARQT